MAKVSSVNNVPGKFVFKCPGCKTLHWFHSGPELTPTWDFNGDMEKPTLSPSHLTWGDYGPEKKEWRCHSFIKEGKIQYLDDSTHHLKGQTVDLPDWDS